MENIDIHTIRQFGNIEFLAKQMVEGFITGLHKSPYHGFSVEFAEHRLYNAGESTRHIDWKVYARTDKLFVKRYEEETNLRCQIIVDCSSSMYFPIQNKEKHSKLSFSLIAAAAIAQMLHRQRDAVGMMAFDEDLLLKMPPKSTPRHIHQLMIELQRLSNIEKNFDKNLNNRRSAIAKMIHLAAENIHRRSLVIIFSDMMDNMNPAHELFAAIQRLRHNLHEVLIFDVRDAKSELNFGFEDRLYEFVDVETGITVKAHASEVRDLYKKNIEKARRELMLRCGQYKIDYFMVDVENGFDDQVLMPLLIKRTKMK